jgi:hypothetical protein
MKRDNVVLLLRYDLCESLNYVIFLLTKLSQFKVLIGKLSHLKVEALLDVGSLLLKDGSDLIFDSLYLMLLLLINLRFILCKVLLGFEAFGFFNKSPFL